MLNRANLAAACLVELSNKMCEEDFSSLKAMHEHMQKMEKKKKRKKLQMKVLKRVMIVKTTKKMNKCQNYKD